MLSVILTILALGFLIFIHEMGHLLAAKYSGVGVYEFAIGMGPKIVSKHFSETEYSLRLLPFGGFVKLAGMDGDSDVADKDNYYLKPLRFRFLTISAGSLMNIFFGCFIYFCIFFFAGIVTFDPTVSMISDNSPAMSAGFQVGDRIVQVNGHDVASVRHDVVRRVRMSNGVPLTFTVQSPLGEEKNLQVAPVNRDGQYSIGVGFDSERHRFDIIASIGASVSETIQSTMNVFRSLKMLFSGQANVSDLSGPVGIVQFASSSLSSGAVAFFGIVAMISVSLGVFNLFPFPVLDGGHLLLLLIEWIRGKRANEKIETVVHNIGAVVLIALMLVVVVNDILSWQDRVSLFNRIFPTR